jgi:WD40 repeat protein
MGVKQVQSGQKTRHSVHLAFIRDGAVTSIAFSPDGQTLATGCVDDLGNGTVQFWDVAYLDNPAPYLCASAGRSLTPTEWTVYAPGPAYQNICR